MPYLTSQRKKDLRPTSPLPAVGPGDLNYQITQIVLDYLGPTYDYRRLNDVVGALESAKLEFYSRVVRPYERDKMEINGDVYFG